MDYIASVFASMTEDHCSKRIATMEKRKLVDHFLLDSMMVVPCLK